MTDLGALDAFFAGHDTERTLFECVRRVIESIGAAELRVTRSQVAFYRRRVFAMVWIPSQYLKNAGAPLVLTVSLRRHSRSSRWKEVVEPYPGRFTHHLELHSAAELDDEVHHWLREAWELAG